MATTAITPNQSTIPLPAWLQKVRDDYTSKVAHVFLLYGNVHDFPDNTGNNQLPWLTMNSVFDTNYRADLLGGSEDEEKKSGRGLQVTGDQSSGTDKIMARFTKSQGLEFRHPASREMFEQFLTGYFGQETIDNSWREDWRHPMGVEGLLFILNRWMYASKERVRKNRAARKRNATVEKELYFTLLIEDGDSIFPEGNIANLGQAGDAIVNLRQWAREEPYGDRNKIIVLVRHLSEVHESLRGAVGVSTVQIPRPTVDDREEWLTRFDHQMQLRVKGQKLELGGHNVKRINLAEGFTFKDFAIQSAGMSRRQLKDVCMQSWLSNVPIDFQLVRERKQRALMEEYEGIVDFFEPEHGFEQIGGHDNLKDYFKFNVIEPLRNNDRRTCSKGVLLTGPPGTGKTVLAKALAKEAKMNFMIGHLDKLFGGLVGETEKKTRKFIEAIESAAPVIVFLDEIDSALSSGRTSSGDSGVSGRVFNALMTFLSDESRAGKVVVVAASNRPDLLDAALIRSGRFDAKVPALPPYKGDAKGRKAILAALVRKLGDIKFGKDIAATDPTLDGYAGDGKSGLARLLSDNERIWTGAEIEVVLKKAVRLAMRDKSKAINLNHWNDAFQYVIPNTQQVERMTNLALLYVDDLEYCPAQWRQIAADKTAIRNALGMSTDEE
jgi:transitional endoplasmic reticulum ATPase